jgi:hypothetical protein
MVWHDRALKLLHERFDLGDLTFYRNFFTSTAHHAARIHPGTPHPDLRRQPTSTSPAAMLIFLALLCPERERQEYVGISVW